MNLKDLDSKFPLAITTHILTLLRRVDLTAAQRQEYEQIITEIAAFAQYVVDNELHLGTKKGKRAPKAQPLQLDQEPLFEEPEEEEVPSLPKKKPGRPRKIKVDAPPEEDTTTDENATDQASKPEKLKKYKNPGLLETFYRKP
jgi:hypothetical protein